METFSSDLVFKALADPTRRQIIHLLSLSECSVKKLTASFSMSQPAISQHLRQLRSARLVVRERVGVEHRYRLRGNPLREVFDWTAKYRRFFDTAGHVWSFALAAPDSRTKSARSRSTKGSRKHGN